MGTETVDETVDLRMGDYTRGFREGCRVCGDSLRRTADMVAALPGVQDLLLRAADTFDPPDAAEKEQHGD